MTNEKQRAPGPPGLPIAGNVFEAWRDALGLMTKAARCGEVAELRFGPFLRYHVLSGAAGIHHVLKTNAKNYVKSRNYAGMKFILGEGLLTSEGEFWKRQRRLAQPAFHHARLAGFAETMSCLTGEAISGLRAGQVDAHAEMMRLTFRIVGATLFSTDVAAHADDVGTALDVAIHWAQAYAEQVVRLPPWVPTPANLRFRSALATLDRLVCGIIAARRDSGADPGDLLGMLMSVRDDAGQAMSDRQLRDETMTIVLAGHETTANALAFALHLVARHPEVERRLQREADAVLGGRPVRFEDLPKLEYTERVIEESMRLYPPAWCFEREALADDRIEGFAIPKGTMVAVCPFTLHRSEKYWPEPERFDPDRFLPERAEGRPKEAYLPFGDGPRVCIGKAFAMMEAKIVLATVASRMSVAPASHRELDLEPGITLRPRGGVPLKLSERPFRTSREVGGEPLIQQAVRD
jgi:cytochrome P450